MFGKAVDFAGEQSKQEEGLSLTLLPSLVSITILHV